MIMVAYLIVMGCVRKSAIPQYWSTDNMLRTPFFAKYMPRNKFQLLLGNLHLNDNANDLPEEDPQHDRLYKIRPFLEMCERNFMSVYKPLRELSFDEGCCPWKGRGLKVFNKSKPAKFHIKLFEVCEAKSGYVLGFDVYTREKAKFEFGTTMDPDCNKTTKIVMKLLQKCELLDKGHHVYTDNYYTSPELMDELFARETYSCGTCRVNRRGLPLALKEAVARVNSELVATCHKDTVNSEIPQ